VRWTNDNGEQKQRRNFSMLIFKMLSHLATALAAFALGTAIVASASWITGSSDALTIEQSPVVGPAPGDTNLSGIYYVAPSNSSSLSKECLQRAEIRPMGYDPLIESHKMPAIRRTMRDGRWFYLETQTSGETSYEFVGIISSETNKGTVIGKLVRLTNGAVSGNVDALYYNPACTDY
jgi:hypothetical protein